MQLKVSPVSRQECNAAEWEARVDLAAAHRLAVMHGFHEGIFNHLTLTVPGRTDRYYQIPFGMHWSEVKASSFMEVGIDDGKVKRGSGDVEQSCYCIHAPIHKALPQAAAVFHTHMPYASALTRLEDPAHQGDRADRSAADERHRLRRQLYRSGGRRPRRAIAWPRSSARRASCSWPTTASPRAGASVAQAYDRLYYVERAAQVQIYAMWTGQRLKQLPEPVVEATKSTRSAPQYDPAPSERHFAALKRILDRKEPDYAE